MPTPLAHATFDKPVHPDYARLYLNYERLYLAGKGRRSAPASFDSPRLAELAHQLEAIAHNDYAQAMWIRRAWLHENGRDGDVYDGTDARDWLAAHRAGRTAGGDRAPSPAWFSSKRVHPRDEGLDTALPISEAPSGQKMGLQKDSSGAGHDPG